MIKSINILGKRYRVSYHQAERVDVSRQVDSLAGQISIADRYIRLSNELTHDDMVHTFLHEAIHAIGTDLHIPGLQIGDPDCERNTDILSMALADMLNRNNLLNKKKFENR